MIRLRKTPREPENRAIHEGEARRMTGGTSKIGESFRVAVRCGSFGVLASRMVSNGYQIYSAIIAVNIQHSDQREHS